MSDSLSKSVLTVAGASSLSLRVLAYFFLRWIPGHPFPPLILTFGIVFISSIVFLGLQNGSRKGSGPSIGKSLGFRQRVKSFLTHHAIGVPSSGGFREYSVSLVVNLVLVFFVFDVVYRGPLLYPSHDVSFSRIGFVSSDSAKILIREPDILKTPVKLSYRAVPDRGNEQVDHGPRDLWIEGPVASYFSEADDFTASVTIDGLTPETSYEYRASSNHSGSFETAPLPGALSGSGDNVFRFLTSSCIKPRFPFNPFDHPLRIPGLSHLAHLLPSLQAQFMLFLGDFIYIDVPHRFGTDAETYRREYRQVYASPSWPPVSQHLPWIHVIDDHEIANDWDRNTTGVYAAATDPWNLYQGTVNPPLVRRGATYFAFTQGPAAFFMLDTRRYRSPEFDLPPQSSKKTMLGPAQLEDLVAWLRQPCPPGVKWKIVVSSIPFTKNWKVNAVDTWAGYLHERRVVLEAMWDTGLEGYGVVVLSGDRHEFAATRFPPPKGSRWPSDVAVHEFSTSPLSMFYLPVRTYWQSKGDEEDEVIKYLPDGNSKFSAVEIARLPAVSRGQLKVRLFIDGKEAWDYSLTSPPIP